MLSTARTIVINPHLQVVYLLKDVSDQTQTPAIGSHAKQGTLVDERRPVDLRDFRLHPNRSSKCNIARMDLRSGSIGRYTTSSPSRRINHSKMLTQDMLKIESKYVAGRFKQASRIVVQPQTSPSISRTGVRHEKRCLGTFYPGSR